MKLIDIHAHLTFKSFRKDLDEVINRAKSAGLIAVIDSGIDPEDFIKAIKVSTKYSNYVFVTLGAAPQQLNEQQYTETLDLIEKYINSVVAIGEIGLDYYWVKDLEQREFTRRAFRELASMAISYDKPIVIHNRDATKDVIDILTEVNAEKVVFHAFMGNLEEARIIINKGWYISIPTIIARSEKHKHVVKHVDLEHIMLETDSPFLAPWPRSRNEPANVKVSAEIISKIKNVSIEKVSDITTRNAIEFFKLPLKL